MSDLPDWARDRAREWYLSIWPGAVNHPESFEPDVASLAALLVEVDNASAHKTDERRSE